MKYNFNSFPSVLHIKNKTFLCEFDHKSIDLLETLTGKGFYKIYQNFISENQLDFVLLKDIISVSTYKHHGICGLKKINSLMKNNTKIIAKELAELKLHFKNLLPDIQSFYKELNLKEQKNNSDFYNFDEIYATARNFLKWSDTEFWAATPKKFCSALTSFYRFHYENEKFKEEMKLKYGLDTLKVVNRILK